MSGLAVPRSRPLRFKRRWQLTAQDCITELTWSPDGQSLAASSARGEILFGPPSQPLESLTGSLSDEPQAINALAFSTDSQLLAAAGQSGQLQVWSCATQSPVLSQPLTQGWLDCLAWHPTEPLLAIAVGAVVQVWDLERGATIERLDFVRSSVLALAWHPEGTYLAASGHGGVAVWSADDWSAAPQLIAVPGASIAVQWSGNGHYLASGNLGRTLTVVEWNSPPPWFMQGFPGKVRRVAWSEPLSATGAPLLAAACLNGITVWERERSAGGIWRNRVLEHHTQTVPAIAFQPRTLTLASASADGQLVLWHQAQSAAQVLTGTRQGWSQLAWSPSGQHLAAGGRAGELLLWSQSQRSQGFSPERLGAKPTA